MKYREGRPIKIILRTRSKHKEMKNIKTLDQKKHILWFGTPKHGALKRDNDDSSKLGNHNYEL